MFGFWLIPLACGNPPGEAPTAAIPARVPKPVALPVPPAPASPTCPPTVADLPASPLYDTSDARLQGDALIVVLKGIRRLGVYRDGSLVPLGDDGSACWPVGLASGYVDGHKQRQGDLRTPEGWQRTSDRPWSRFYHALTVHYPSPDDAARGLTDGLITQAQHDAIVEAHRKRHLPPMNTKLGGLIAIHGGGGSSDWTLGCVALDDDAIDAMRGLLPSTLRTDLLVLP